MSRHLPAILTLLMLTSPMSSLAETASVTLANPATSIPKPALPAVTPTAPTLSAKGYVLMDAASGKILASQNADERMPPASLTKMMTSYVISAALREGRIHAEDLVRISDKAWRTGGSKMFVKIGTDVPVHELMQGIIVDSGNDACVAMAEYLAGTEEAFVSLMNQQAAALGMTNTHFTDSTGLPNPDHYTSPRDIAILARALIVNFPEDYKWYSQKWFTYNGIKQPNRNRLLWRDPTVDGIKTGHTDEAGYCLAASALRNGTRLISIVMGAPTDAARAEDSQRVLNYGFRFFETHKLYNAGAILAKARVWQGAEREVSVGVTNDMYITLPPGQYANLKATVALSDPIKAPVLKGQLLGTVEFSLQGEKLSSAPLVALEDDAKGGLWTRFWDWVRLSLHNLFSK